MDGARDEKSSLTSNYPDGFANRSSAHKLTSWVNCQDCLKGAAEIKFQLNAQLIRDLTESKREKCYLIGDYSSRQACLNDVAKLNENLMFLFTNRVENFCIYVGACWNNNHHETTSKPTLKQQIDLVLSMKQIKYEEEITPEKCKECQRESMILKDKLNPILVGEIVRLERIVCMTNYPENSVPRRDCYAKINNLNDDLNYLLTHNEGVFCEKIRACPRASPIM